jgi:small subunit ribosomal protein S1
MAEKPLPFMPIKPKAVPALPPEPAEVPSAVPPKPVPALPTVPKRGVADAEIERELEAAMSGMDMEAMLEPASTQQGKGGKPKPRDPNELRKGRVLSIRGKDVFVDVGGRYPGVISVESFPEPPQIGQEVEATVDGVDEGNGLLLLSKKGAAVHVDWSSVAPGLVVEARVTGTNKGGLSVEVNGIRGFMPISQIELFRIEDLTPYVNQKLRCLITEANPGERNLVVSRRALLEQERVEAKKKLWETLAEGKKLTGTVRNIKEFGAFIDLGGVDALLPISEMSWTRVENPAQILQLGQQVEVVILRINQENQKLTVGLKQLKDNPWDDAEFKYPMGTVVPGKVTRLMDFGAFVELEPGVEGLVHISELSKNRVNKPSDVVKVGQDVNVKVLKLDRAQGRISLSIKGAVAEPPPEPEPEPVVETPGAAEQPKKKEPPPRKVPLKGGLGR